MEIFNKKHFISILSFFIAFSVNAKKFTIDSKDKTAKVVIELPNGFNIENGMMGLQYVAISKQNSSGNRAVISAGVMNVDFDKIDNKSLKEQQYQYQQGREKWLKRFQGNSKKFFKLKKNPLEQVKSFGIGFQYTLSGKDFEEYTVYAKCKNNTFHIKYLFNLEDSELYKSRLTEMFKSIRCEGESK